MNLLLVTIFNILLVFIWILLFNVIKTFMEERRKLHSKEVKRILSQLIVIGMFLIIILPMIIVMNLIGAF